MMKFQIRKFEMISISKTGEKNIFECEYNSSGLLEIRHNVFIDDNMVFFKRIPVASKTIQVNDPHGVVGFATQLIDEYLSK